MQKQINARLVQKSGFESEWLLATNFIPINGELIVYKAEADQNGNLFTDVALPVGRTTPYTYARFKIGDGHTLVNALPFFAGEGNGASQVQADWAQTNEEAADFIKNKPFGKTQSFENAIVWSNDMFYNESLSLTDYTNESMPTYTYYLASTQLLTKEQLLNSKLTYIEKIYDYESMNTTETTHVETINSLTDVDTNVFKYNNLIYVVLEAGSYSDFTASTAGIYVRNDGEDAYSGIFVDRIDPAVIITKIDEEFLPNISGSGLPEVSVADNDSFLRVVDGAWEIVKFNVYDGSVV